MPKLTHKNAITSVTLRVKIVSSSDGSALTGLTYNSSGLIIAVIKDDEASATAYTQAAGNIQDISTLGTYAEPSENKCRFKELDSTNHPGIYELHIANAIWNDTSARSAIVTVSGVSGMLPVDAEIQLVKYDPLDSVRLGLTALPNAAADAAGGLPISDAGGLDLDTTDSNVTAIKAKTDTIGANFTVSSPVFADGTVEIVQGDDYLSANSDGITLTVTGYTGPLTTGDTVYLAIMTADNYNSTSTTAEASSSATVDVTAGTLTATFDLTDVQTAALDVTPPDEEYNHRYHAWGVHDTDKISTFARGSMTVRKQIPEAS